MFRFLLSLRRFSCAGLLFHRPVQSFGRSLRQSVAVSIGLWALYRAGIICFSRSGLRQLFPFCHLDSHH